MSFNISASSFQAQIRAKLVSIFAAEMNVGPNGPGTGSNVAGRLQPVYSGPYRSVAVQPPYPAIGIQFKRDNYEFSGSSRLDFTAEFLILVAVQATLDSSGQVLLDEAHDQLDAIVDDGNANGIRPILLDPVNYQLGGLVNTAILSSTEYAWQDPSMTDSAPLMYAALTFKVSRQVARRLANPGDDAVPLPVSTAAVAAGANAAAVKTTNGYLYGITVTAVGSLELTITDGVGGKVLAIVSGNQVLGDIPFAGGPRPFYSSLWVNSYVDGNGNTTPAITLIYT